MREAMPRKSLMVILALAAPPLFGAPPQAIAQMQASPPHQPRRITVSPRPLLYRRCTDWYELQNRPSGTVLYPQMHCWWVRG
jgi:hypothetical protein